MLLTLTVPLTAHAHHVLSPWYFGAGMGVNDYEVSNDQVGKVSLDDDTTFAGDIFAGYFFNQNFGFELGYRYLGEAEMLDSTSTSYTIETKGITAGLVAFLPLSSKWSLSAEAGAMNYQISSDSSEYTNDNGIAPYLGAGVGYNITKNVKLQAQYRRYESSWDTFQMNSNYMGLELSYRFKGKNLAVAPTDTVNTPLDTDGDGVNDDLDICPNTPTTHQVDSRGCSEYVKKIEQHDLAMIQFANNSSLVTQDSYKYIDDLANYMNRYPQSTVLISGHASKVGNEEYNIKLSLQRANSVAMILIEKYGIGEVRVETKGFGSSEPKMKGTSARANEVNRRIEAHVSRTTQEVLLK